MADVAKDLGIANTAAADYCKLASFFLQKGEHEGAEGAAELAVALAPEEAEAWALLGASRAKLKRYAEAVPAYLEALKRRPDDIASWTDLGEVYVYLMDFEHASAALKQALELDPDGQNAWGRRARAVVARVIKQLKR